MLKPCALTDAFSVALIAVTGVAASVATVGSDGVVNDSTAPNEVPTEFWPIAQ